MKKFDTLYKKDTTGKIRTWRMEADGDSIRAISGIKGGKQVTSSWKKRIAKNVGRANATTAEEQAEVEIKALYKKKLESEYHKRLKDVDEVIRYNPMLAAGWDDLKDKVNQLPRSLTSQRHSLGFSKITQIKSLTVSYTATNTRTTSTKLFHWFVRLALAKKTSRNQPLR
jgi:hypothetical protein